MPPTATMIDRLDNDLFLSNVVVLFAVYMTSWFYLEQAVTDSDVFLKLWYTLSIK